jgi:hypothetical protein
MTQTAAAVPNASPSTAPAGWLSVARAAMILGRSQRSVQTACRAGRLRAILAGGDAQAWYIDPASRQEFRIARGDDGPGPAAPDSCLSALSEVKRQAVYERHLMVQGFLDAAAARPRGTNLCAFRDTWLAGWNQKNPGLRTSLRTLARLVRIYKEEGIRGLVDERQGCRASQATPEAVEFLVGCWLQEDRPTIRSVYEQAQALAPQFGWVLPSYRHALRILRRHVRPAVGALGRDPRGYRDRMDMLVSRDWSKVAAMELWVADHRQLDVWVPRQGEDGRWTWHRPWLTALLDARSWYPVAWTLAWDSPDANRVLGTLIRAVREHGQPEWIYLDNGKDFRADRIAGGRREVVGDPADRTRAESILGRLGIEVVWAIPYNARAKVIENWFRAAVAEKFDRTWSTYCASTTQDRPERLRHLNPADMAAKGLTIEAVRAALARWINDDYALLECPVKASRGYSTLRAFRHLRRPDFVERRPCDDTLKFLLLPSKPLTVTQKGVKISEFNQTYWSPALEDLRGASGRDDARKVIVRYDPGDPSKIWVFDRRGRFLAVAEPYIGAGLHPLARAGTEEDRERLGRAMELKGQIRKADAASVRYYRGVAQKFAPALERQIQARSDLGLHDDDAQVPAAPAPVILSAGEADRAAAAGTLFSEKYGRRRDVEDVGQVMALRVAAGLESRAAREGGARGRVPSALELVARRTAATYLKESENGTGRDTA